WRRSRPSQAPARCSWSWSSASPTPGSGSRNRRRLTAPRCTSRRLRRSSQCSRSVHSPPASQLRAPWRRPPRAPRRRRPSARPGARRMLELPGVTLLCADTANHALALRALAKSREQVRFGRTLFLTDALPRGVAAPEGVEVVAIPPLASRDAYSMLVLKHLRPYVDTPHALVIQWDGYVVNADAWDPAFLDCDYIGAKWYWHDA